jgi:putative tryptophan/tyrosine transport system substrate-binding protein
MFEANLSPSFNVTRASHAVITTRDLDKTQAFYCDVLGLIASDRDKDALYLRALAMYEYTMSGKWLGLLKEIAPTVARGAVLLNAANPASINHLQTVETAAPALGLQITALRLRNSSEVAPAIAAFAGGANHGLIALPGVTNVMDVKDIIDAAAHHRLPAVYPARVFVEMGGLMSYGLDQVDQFHRAAAYVDRILKGEKPANLPVQNPIKFELIINLKTAKALGLDLSLAFQQRADEVIE